MRYINIYFKIAALLLATPFSAFASEASKPTSHCTAEERTIFSCTTAKKIISYCASPEKAAESYLDYRFGAKGKIELSHRATGADTSKYFKRTEVLAANNGSTVIWFAEGKFNYILNDPVRGSPFLEVRKTGGKNVAMLTCQAATQRDTSVKNPYIIEATTDEYSSIEE